MTLALLTTTWLRPRLTRMVLEHTAALNVPGVEILPIAVFSPEDPEPVTDVDGVRYVSAPNQPVSNKWNAGARMAHVMDVDALMIFGSDDFLSPDWIADATDAVLAGYDYVMPSVLHYYDAATGECVRCECLGKVGVGRTLSRDLLDRLQWQPWQNGRRKLSDKAMDHRVKVQPHRIDTPVCVDVKTEQNEHTFDAAVRALKGAPVDADATLRHYAPNHATELLSWPTKG